MAALIASRRIILSIQYNSIPVAETRPKRHWRMNRVSSPIWVLLSAEALRLRSLYRNVHRDSGDGAGDLAAHQDAPEVRDELVDSLCQHGVESAGQHLGGFVHQRGGVDVDEGHVILSSRRHWP